MNSETMNTWLQLLGQLAPVVLLTIPGGAAFAPLASVVVHAIGEAQQTRATGPAKKAHVLSVVADSVTVANAIAVQAGKPEPFDPAEMHETASVAIDAVVETVKVVKDAHDKLAGENPPAQSSGPGGVTSAVV